MMSCVACLFVHMMSVYSMNLLNPAVSELNMTVH